MAAALAKVKQLDGGQRCVDTLIDVLFFSEETWKDLNLAEVRARIVEDQDDPGVLLALYRRILAGEEVPDDGRSLTHARLKLSGIVKVSPRGMLESSNRIYARVFDLVWVETAQRSLLEKQAVSLTGSGAVAMKGGAAAGRGGVAVGGDVYGNIYTGLPACDPTEALAIYRRVLVEGSRHLSLRGLDVGASDPTGAQQRFDLAQLYVEVLTTTQVPHQKRGKQRSLQRELLREERETRPLPALEAVIAHRRVVLLGDPGSGKSTFLSHLALCLAAQSLEPGHKWLERPLRLPRLGPPGLPQRQPRISGSGAPKTLTSDLLDSGTLRKETETEERQSLRSVRCAHDWSKAS